MAMKLLKILFTNMLVRGKKARDKTGELMTAIKTRQGVETQTHRLDTRYSENSQISFVE